MDTDRIHRLCDLIQCMLNHCDMEIENRRFLEGIHTDDLNNPLDKDIDHQHPTREHMFLEMNATSIIARRERRTNRCFDKDSLDRRERVSRRIPRRNPVHTGKCPTEVELRYTSHCSDTVNDCRRFDCADRVHRMAR